MCGSQKRFSELVLDSTNLFSFSQFSYEKLKRFTPSEAVHGFLDGVTTRSSVFFLKYFFLSVNYYINNTTVDFTIFPYFVALVLILIVCIPVWKLHWCSRNTLLLFVKVR